MINQLDTPEVAALAPAESMFANRKEEACAILSVTALLATVTLNDTFNAPKAIVFMAGAFTAVSALAGSYFNRH